MSTNLLPRRASPITTRPGFRLRWRTLAMVALRMMLHDKLKMMGTLAGVIFAVLLSNQQAGTFMGLIYKNIMFVANTDADVWITPNGTEQSTSVVPRSGHCEGSIGPGTIRPGPESTPKTPQGILPPALPHP